MLDALVKSKDKDIYLHIFECDSFWLNETKKIIPEEYLKYIKFVTDKPQLIKYEGINCLKYENLEDFTPDLILVDGPNLNDYYGDIDGLSSKEVIKTSAISNIIDYSYSVRYFIFDNRFDCVKLLYQKSLKTFNFTYYYRSKQFLVKKDHSIIKPYISSKLIDFILPSHILRKHLNNDHRIKYKYFDIY